MCDALKYEGSGLEAAAAEYAAVSRSMTATSLIEEAGLSIKLKLRWISDCSAVFHDGP